MELEWKGGGGGAVIIWPPKEEEDVCWMEEEPFWPDRPILPGIVSPVQGGRRLPVFISFSCCPPLPAFQSVHLNIYCSLQIRPP